MRIHIGMLHLWQTTPARRPLLPRIGLISAPLSGRANDRTKVKAS